MNGERDLVSGALPNYDVGGELGRGGWGVVLEGRHRQLGRLVAIKQLPRAFGADPEVRARFVTEARLLAALDHPHIVPVYDYVEYEGLCLLVMEKLPGGTVWDRFRKQGIGMQAACAMVLAACAGLQFAHEHDVLHRDVKPENLMFSATGTLKVTDFGIAKVLGGSRTLATKAGEVVGTPAYMAPEQARGDELSPATDVYAAGTVLYELLSGRLPFPDKGNAMATLYQHVHEAPQVLSAVAPQVPPPIAAVVMRAIATNGQDRYAGAEDLGVALAEAANAAWGAGWLATVGLPILSAGRIAGASSGAAVVTASPGAPAPPTIVPAGSTPPTVVPPVVSPAVAAPADERPPSTIGPGLPWAGATVPIREDVRTHSGKAALLDVEPADLVPVEVLARSARTTRVPVLISVGLLLVGIAVAFAGMSSPAHSGDLALTINGVDPTAAGAPAFDLSKPVHLAGANPGDTDRVRVTWSVLHIPLGHAAAALTLTPGGGFTADVDGSGARYLAGGRTTADVELLRNGAVRSHRSFAFRAKQPAIVSAPGAAGLALLLFVLATGESLLRSMRRGQRRSSGYVGMVLVGAAVGVATVVVAWLTSVREPTAPTMVTTAVIGAASGVAAAKAAGRAARN